MADQFERRRLRVYVAGPISADPFEGIHRGFAAARRMFLDGLAPFIPHADALFFLPDGHWPEYLEYDLEYVSVCDAVYRLSGASKGADKECAVARELGIPVFTEGLMGRTDGDLEFIGDGYDMLLAYAEERGLKGVRGQDG